MLTNSFHRRQFLSAILLATVCLIAAAPDQVRGEETDTVTIAFEFFPSSPEHALAIIDRFENDAVGIVTDVPPEDTATRVFDLYCDGEYHTFSNQGYMLLVTKGETYIRRGYVLETSLPANHHGFMRLGPESDATVDVLSVQGSAGLLSCVDPESPNFWWQLLIVVTGELSH